MIFWFLVICATWFALGFWLGVHTSTEIWRERAHETED